MHTSKPAIITHDVNSFTIALPHPNAILPTVRRRRLPHPQPFTSSSVSGDSSESFLTQPFLTAAFKTHFHTGSIALFSPRSSSPLAILPNLAPAFLTRAIINPTFTPSCVFCDSNLTARILMRQGTSARPSMFGPDYESKYSQKSALTCEKCCESCCLEHQKPLFQAFEKLLDEEINTDIDITAVDVGLWATKRIFRAHRAFVSARFPGMQEDLQPNSDSRYTVEEVNPEAVWRFLKWCYVGDYPGDPDSRSNPERDGSSRWREEEEYDVHLQLYALATRWDIPELKQTVVRKFCTFWDSIDSLEDYGNDFINSAYEVFQTYAEDDVDEELRNVVVDAGNNFHTELMQSDSDQLFPCYRSLLEEVPNYTVALILRYDEKAPCSVCAIPTFSSTQSTMISWISPGWKMNGTVE